LAKLMRTECVLRTIDVVYWTPCWISAFSAY